MYLCIYLTVCIKYDRTVQKRTKTEEEECALQAMIRLAWENIILFYSVLVCMHLNPAGRKTFPEANEI